MVKRATWIGTLVTRLSLPLVIFLIVFPGLLVWFAGSVLGFESGHLIGLVLGCIITIVTLYFISHWIPKEKFDRGTGITAVVLAVFLGVMTFVAESRMPKKPTEGEPPTPAGLVLSDSIINSLEAGVRVALTRADVHAGAGNFEMAERITQDARETLEGSRGHPRVEFLVSKLIECQQSARQQIHKDCSF